MMTRFRRLESRPIEHVSALAELDHWIRIQTSDSVRVNLFAAIEYQPVNFQYKCVRRLNTDITTGDETNDLKLLKILINTT